MVGFVQLGSTYLMDIYQFMGFWAGKVQFNQFGAGWSYIVYNLGQYLVCLLRRADIVENVFSLSGFALFPQFILLGLPAIFVVFFNRKKYLFHWFPRSF